MNGEPRPSFLKIDHMLGCSVNVLLIDMIPTFQIMDQRSHALGQVQHGLRRSLLIPCPRSVEKSHSDNVHFDVAILQQVLSHLLPGLRPSPPTHQQRVPIVGLGLLWAWLYIGVDIIRPDVVTQPIATTATTTPTLISVGLAGTCWSGWPAVRMQTLCPLVVGQLLCRVKRPGTKAVLGHMLIVGH